MRRLPYMLTCREADDFITDYLDGTLPARERRKFELHLRVCRDCRRYLEGYRRTLALARSAMGEAEAPEEPPEALVRAILAAKDETKDDEP